MSTARLKIIDGGVKQQNIEIFNTKAYQSNRN